MASSQEKDTRAKVQESILTSADLVPGKTLDRGKDKLTVRSIEKHYGNVQVRYYSAVLQKEQWDQIERFLKSVAAEESA